MDEATLKQQGRGVIIVDLSSFESFLDAHPIMKLLSPVVGGFYFGPTTCLTAYFSILMAGQDLQTKTFLDLNLNLELLDAERMGTLLRKSRASMVSVQCSSGIESIKKFVKAMNKDSQPFRETWDVPVPETKTESIAVPAKDTAKKIEENAEDDGLKAVRERLAKRSISEPIIRPLIFAVTVPNRFTHSTSGPAIGNYDDRMRSYDYIVEKGGVDGVICAPNKLTRYHRSIYDHVKKLVSGVDPKAPLNSSVAISPTAAINSGATYLLIEEAILKPPKGSSMEKEAEKIKTEIIVALEKKSRIKISVEVPKPAVAPAKPEKKPVPPTKIKPVSLRPEKKIAKAEKKGFFSIFPHQ